MNTPTDWITFFCSVIVAAIVSLATFLFDVKKHKESLITEAITANRIEWVTNVRELIGEFLCAYIDGKSKQDLIKLIMKVKLFLRDKPDYNKLVECMNDCCEGTFSQEKADKLIQVAQYVFQRVWVRIKIEGGQSQHQDSKVREMVDKYVGVALRDL